jgi:hypothetical protein
MTQMNALVREIKMLQPEYVDILANFIANIKHSKTKTAATADISSRNRVKDMFSHEELKAAKPLYGLFVSDGCEVDRFLERKHADKALEDANDRRQTG